MIKNEFKLINKNIFFDKFMKYKKKEKILKIREKRKRKNVKYK
jgi:hypothetical protein